MPQPRQVRRCRAGNSGDKATLPQVSVSPVEAWSAASVFPKLGIFLRASTVGYVRTHSATSAAPRRTAQSGSPARAAHAAETPRPASPGGQATSCAAVCNQSPWLSSARATARATSRTTANDPCLSRASAVTLATNVFSGSSKRRSRTAAADAAPACGASRGPAAARTDLEGDRPSSIASVRSPLLAKLGMLACCHDRAQPDPVSNTG